MLRKWVTYLLLIALSGVISYLIASHFSKQTIERLKFYVDGKVATR